MRFFLLLLVTLLLIKPIHSQESSEVFAAASAAYQKGEYEEAKNLFAQLYEQHPQSPQLMFNLGLAHYNLGDKGKALGLWRKARFLTSGLDPIEKAIDFAEEELVLRTEQGNVFTSLATWIQKIPSSLWYLLTLILTFTVGWKIIILFAKRKIPLTDWPVSIFFLMPLWLMVFSISLWLSQIEMERTATVTDRSVSTRTGPSESSPSLTSLDEGVVVTILKEHKDWVQVQPQSGSPGWVQKSQIIAIKD